MVDLITECFHCVLLKIDGIAIIFKNRAKLLTIKTNVENKNFLELIFSGFTVSSSVYHRICQRVILVILRVVHKTNQQSINCDRQPVRLLWLKVAVDQAAIGHGNCPTDSDG